jgi:hypothetical protein
MKPLIRFVTFILLIGNVIFISCKKEYSCDECIGDNRSPIANAGPDQVITLPTDSVSLDGRQSSDPDGTISSYLWTKISGPASFTIIKPADSITGVKALVAGAYQFELKVTDNGGLSAKDTVHVIVNDPTQPNNHPPVANAGADKTITLPTNTVTLDGSASTDPDNNIVSYAWTKISGPSSFNITNTNAVQTAITNLVQGIYQFELKVTDAGLLFSKDTMQVIVDNTIHTSCPFQKTLIGTLYPFRYAFKTVTAGSKIVFAGGFEVDPAVGSVPSSKVDIYDMVTQTWSSFDLPNHGGHVATIAAGDKIFFAGGSATNSTGGSSSRVDIYNTADNTWTSTQLSEPRYGMSAVKAGNKILFAGGLGTSVPSTKVDIYDLSTASWSVADIQHSIYAASALGNKAIFEAYTSFDIYDALSNSWSTFPLSGSYYNMSTATLGTKIYLAGGYNGGYNGNNFSNLVHIYDVVSDTWSSTTMSQPKGGITSIGAGGKIFWAGGFDSVWNDGTEDYARYVNDIEMYDANTGTLSHHFMSLDGMLYGGYGVTNSHVLFRSPSTNDLHICNLNSGTWTICNTDLGWAPQAISIGNTIYVAGPVGTQTTNLKVWKLEF